MRDIRFVAEHRGGLLKKEQHRELIKWAVDCAQNVLFLFGEHIDERLQNAILTAKEWEMGSATVGEARKASLGAISVANEASDPVSIAVARAIGHAVATAHMADHSLGSALYSLKAVSYSGRSVEEERKRQIERLPDELKELIKSAMAEKEKHFKLKRNN